MYKRIVSKPAGSALIVLALTGYCLLNAGFRSAPPVTSPTGNNQAELGLYFEPNVGQSGNSVRYIAHAPGAEIYFARGEVALALSTTRRPTSANKSVPGLAAPAEEAMLADVVKIGFVGANPAAAMQSGTATQGRVNYLRGNDANKWHTNVPLYSNITYKSLYSGVDLTYSGEQGQLKGTYRVAPNADPSQIRWQYSGISTTPGVDASGNLVISLDSAPGTQHPALTELAPVAWQEIDGNRINVDVRYEVGAGGSVGFAVSEYDRSQPLVIDPTLAYSTYLGGNASDNAYGIAVDASHNMYVAGLSASTDYPLQDPLQGALSGGSDMVVTKLNAQGNALIYSTYIGGSGLEWVGDIDVDSAGNVVVAGKTASANFPTVNPKQGSSAGQDDAVVLKLNAQGSALIFSTYLGGSNFDQANGVAIDPAGNVYVGGMTRSTNFPTQNALQPATGGGVGDAFVAKYTPDGQSFVYSTYLGGDSAFSEDVAFGIAADSAGNAYATGDTTSQNFPVANAFMPTYRGGESDIFITKINPTGSAFVYSTYLGGGQQTGGTGADTGYGIAADSAGNAYITGDTDSMDFPTMNAIHPALNGFYDVFVAEMNPAGSALVYSTYFGGNGSGNERGMGIAVNASGEVGVVGIVDNDTFPVVNAIQNSYGGALDAFMLKITASGTQASFVTYLGGSGSDYGQAVDIDDDGSVYGTGLTASFNYPLANPYQGQRSAPFDMFITKIADPSGGTPTAGPSATATNTPVPTGTTIATATRTPTRTTTPTPPQTATVTATATGTNTPVVTQTGVLPSSTSTLASTSTAVATGTHSASPTRTSTPTVTPTCAAQFTDVPPDSTFYAAVHCIACNGIIEGYYADCETGIPCFRPGNTITRGQLAKVAARAAVLHDPVGTQQFEDVVPTSTFYEYIWRLAARGIVSGYPCGGAGEPCGAGNLPYFRPGSAVTRGQIAKIISNTAGFNDTPSGQQFEDIAENSTFYPFVYRLAIRSIMSGYRCGGAGEPCGTGNLAYFRPNSDATRGQAAKITANTFFPGCIILGR